MKSLKESLFGDLKQLTEGIFGDNIKSNITTLYDLFGKHIKKFQHTYGEGRGWTHFYNQMAVVREWKKEGRPELSGGFSKTTFPSDLQKFIAVILKNTIIYKDKIAELSATSGIIDDKYLNDELDKAGIIWPEDTQWGSQAVGLRRIRVQINYIEGIRAGPDHGVSFNTVGVKKFKGLNTDKIEITIYAYDPKQSGFGSHIWTLLTDLSINDFK